MIPRTSKNGPTIRGQKDPRSTGSKWRILRGLFANMVRSGLWYTNSLQTWKLLFSSLIYPFNNIVIFHSYVSLPEGTPFDPPLKSSSCSLMFSLQLTLKIDHVGCICPEFSRRIQISSKLIIKWCNSYHIISYYIISDQIILYHR